MPASGAMATASAATRARRPAMPAGASAHSTGGRAKTRTVSERQAIDAEHGGALHQGSGIGERIAQHVPGKAAQHVAAQPLRRRQRQGQHEDAARPGPGEPRGDACSRGVEEGKAGRQQRDGEGQQHGEGLGLDQECLADPEQAGHEIAEAEPPADFGGCDGWARMPGQAFAVRTHLLVIPAAAGIHAGLRFECGDLRRSPPARG